MPPESVRKRRAWLGWVPAIVLSVVIVGVAITTGVLISTGLGAPAPKPTVGQVTELNWSSFSEEGRAYIASSRQVRIDFSRPPVEAVPLGLDGDGILVLEPISTGDTSLDYSLIVNGGGEGAGGDKFIVTELSIETAGGLVTHVRAPLRDVVNFRQTLDALLDKAELFGWDTATDDIYATADAATRAGEHYQFSFGPASRAGFDATATASCDVSGYCLVEYDLAPTMR